MADKKISQLTAASLPLAGTEIVPVVQSGTTKKTTIDEILSPASGKGINFAAAGGDTLSIYDEGTIIPFVYGGTVNGAGTYTVQNGKYTRIGNCVYYYINLAWSAHTGSGALFVGGLPFTVFNTTQCNGNFLMDVPSAAGLIPMIQVLGNTTTLQLLTYDPSTGNAGTIGLPATSSYFLLQGFYFV